MMRMPACLTLVLVFTLCGCGNKGPLVLPPDPPADEAEDAQPTPAARDAGAEADPLPADEADEATPPLPTEVPAEQVPLDPEPATPTDDASDDDPPGES